MEAYLILENGKVFQGQRFGASADVTGEIVFTTAMTGYIETLTDPSYFGQIVVQTFPLIGNYGIISEDFESNAPHVKAYIVKEWCQEPSNFRMEGNLDAFLKENNIVGLCGIDTRELTKIVREYGVMNGRIMSRPDVSDQLLSEIRDYKITGAVAAVTGQKQETMAAEDAIQRVVLWDFGAKENIRRELLKRRCEVVTVPAGTTAEEILALAAGRSHAVQRTGGPGGKSGNCAATSPYYETENTDIRHLSGASALGALTRRNDGKIKIWSPGCKPTGEKHRRRYRVHFQSKSRLCSGKRFVAGRCETLVCQCQ